MQRPPEQPPDYLLLERFLVRMMKKAAIYIAAFLLLYLISTASSRFDRWFYAEEYAEEYAAKRAEYSSQIEGLHVPGTDRPLYEIMIYSSRGPSFMTPPGYRMESAYTREEVRAHFNEELRAAGWTELVEINPEELSEKYASYKGEYRLILNFYSAEGKEMMSGTTVWLLKK